MLTVVETAIFREWAAKVWSDVEREEFIDWISAHPEAGDVIPGTGGLRKVRWSRAGMGKRGGTRAIYFTRLAQGQIVLVVAYAKAKFDDMPRAVLRKWKAALDESFGE
ncbi:transcriptional regulator [Hydrocarboniphaga sp.]|uniref:transcriptional regulator n=1 Tax=Hydrocarboniphaga sp. TaxID=2033016 RepID=UPI003454FEA7